jgi:hypothetical protein
MTTVGRLFDYGFDREKPWVNWREVDKVIFGSVGHNDINPLRAMDTCIAMVQEQFSVPLQNIWRVHIGKDDLVTIHDFTMPSNQDTITKTFRQEELPLWLQDSLSVLMIVDEGVTVEGLGKKINDSIFYVVETPDLKEIYGDKA